VLAAKLVVRATLTDREGYGHARRVFAGRNLVLARVNRVVSEAADSMLIPRRGLGGNGEKVKPQWLYRLSLMLSERPEENIEWAKFSNARAFKYL
jgi:hypothetical protein